MMRANQGSWLPGVLAPLLVQNPNLPSWIFSERTVGRSDCSSTKEGLITARLCARCSRGRERKRKLNMGRRAGLFGEIWIWFFASRTSLWNTCVDQRQCETCVLTSSKHVPLTLGSPFGVCYPAVCLQVAGPRRVVSSGVLGNIRFGGETVGLSFLYDQCHLISCPSQMWCYTISSSYRELFSCSFPLLPSDEVIKMTRKSLRIYLMGEISWSTSDQFSAGLVQSRGFQTVRHRNHRKHHR